MNNRENTTNSLPRQERLRGRGAVSTLFSGGQSGFVYPIRYVWRVAEGDEPTSVLFTVPKRFHKRANKRNLLRRRVKEAYRLQKSLLGDGPTLNIALIYSSKEREEYDKISRTVAKILGQIAVDSGRVVAAESDESNR